MKRGRILLGILGVSSLIGVTDCTTTNKSYCDANEDCPSGRCNLDQHVCVPESGGKCGDGVLNSEAEACDGSDFGDATCASETGLAEGQLACSSDCTLDTSGCHECGNGTKEGPEECDGTDLGDATCASETGLAEGQLACNSDCTLDTSDCHECGDGIKEGPEVCDGTDFGDASCATETPDLPQGDLVCAADCSSVDTSGCHQCGNGQIEGPEVCDGTDLEGKTCQDFGFALGTLACGEDCVDYDLSACTNCGDGICQTDGGDSTTSCPQDCGWTQVCAGSFSHGQYSVDITCGLKADGTVWCWGSNDNEMLGVGSTDATVPVPTQVIGLQDATEISCAGEHVCAIERDQSLWCWGYNNHGQVGVDGVSTVTAPLRIARNLEPFDQVAAYAYHTCAHSLHQGNEFNLFCWGTNLEGELGDGTIVSRAEPRCVKSQRTSDCYVFSGSAILAQGPGNHTCVTEDLLVPNPLRWYHWVDCWGSNLYGQTGTGGAPSTLKYPAPADGLPNEWTVQIALGARHTCAVLRDKALWCWGDNEFGQLGDGSTTSVATPMSITKASGLPPLIGVAAGQEHTCAWDQTTLWCWGNNSSGQLGLGDYAHRSSPTKVQALPDAPVSVRASGKHTCAVTASGKLYCWGENENGQLGDGTNQEAPSPVLVQDPYD